MALISLALFGNYYVYDAIGFTDTRIGMLTPWGTPKTRHLAIPTKPNTIPEAIRTGFRAEIEQRSERSDAGVFIVE